MVNSVGAFASPNVTNPPFPASVAVANTDSHKSSEQNQETYFRLKAALGLNLRRQVFVAVCDDLILRDRIARQLQVDLGGWLNRAQTPQPESSQQISRYPRLVSLNLDIQNPNPIIQISHWLAKFPPPQQGDMRMPMPAFQILGIELLSRQPASIQWLFLTYLQGIERSLPALESSILFWMPRPWVRIIPQSAPEFWHCRTALFDFVGEPTPVGQHPKRLNSSASTPARQPRSPRQPTAPQQPTAKSAAQLPNRPTPPAPKAPVPPPPPSLSISSQRDRQSGFPKAAPSVSASATPSQPKAPSTPAPAKPTQALSSDALPSRPAADSSAQRPSSRLPQPQRPVPADPPAEAETQAMAASAQSGTPSGTGPQSTPSSPVDSPTSPPPPAARAQSQPVRQQEMRSLPPPPPSQQREVAAASPSATDRDDDSARPPSPPISAGVHLNSQSADQLSRSEIEADVAEFDSFDEAESDAEPIPPPISALTPASSQALSASAAVDETVALPSDPPPSPPILPTVPPNTAGNKANPVKPTLTDAALDTEDTTDVTETAAIDYPPTPSPDDEDEAAAITEVEPLDDALDIDLDWDSADDGITELELLPSEVDASQENPPSLTSPDVPALANDAASIASPLTGIGAGASNLANELDLEELDIVDAEPDFLDWSLHGSIQGERAAPASDQSATTAESEDAAPQLPYLPADPQAQSFLNQIEQLHRRRAEPMVLANAYRSLGNLYRDRIEQGNASPQTLMAAMHAYEQVLRWLDDGSPLWAEVLNDMGNLCWLLSRSSPAPDQGLPYLQQGIQFYQVALTKISPQTHPQTYPMIQNNLGAAYGDLARYQDPVENLQRSTQAYQEALRYRKAEDDPMRYASTQNNLGTTYWNLAQHHEPKVYLKQAIAAYAEALRYYRPEQEPLNYAMIQNNLGTAYWNLAQYEQAQDWLALALGAYRMALKYRTLDKAPLAFAATQNNLGTAYWHIATHTKDNPETKRDYLERAIAAYESALSAVQQLTQVAGGPVPLNFDALATHNNLGLVNYELVNDPQITLVNSTWSDCLKASLQNHVAAFQGWQHRLELRQTALQCIIQTVRAFFNKGGLEGQNLALSLLPGSLLPEILPKL